MAYISIKLLDYVKQQASLCLTWLKSCAFVIFTSPLFKKNDQKPKLPAGACSINYLTSLNEHIYTSMSV